MGRTVEELVSALPEDRRERVGARYRDLKAEVEGLRELRNLAGKAQAEIADVLNIKQPSVSKIERQTDLYLSTLRSYVEAIGGELDLVVRLPSRPPLRIRGLSEAGPELTARPRRSRSVARRSTAGTGP